jgi:hypothetical protein
MTDDCELDALLGGSEEEEEAVEEGPPLLEEEHPDPSHIEVDEEDGWVQLTQSHFHPAGQPQL